MTDPQHDLDAFARVRANLSGQDSVFWWTGNIYGQAPRERTRRLFSFEGFNIARIIPVEGGYQLLTREAAFVKDPDSDEILERWHNPLNGRDVTVTHVWNDPVNQVFMAESAHGPFSVPRQDLGNGMVCLSLDLFVEYPSPLQRSDYPLNSQSDLYQGTELFQYFVRGEDLENHDLNDVPCSISWTRLGPWLPWMEMADAPGNLLYQCRGSKLSGGYAALPEQMRTKVEAEHPEYRSAPEMFTEPNETSWTYFKKIEKL